MRVEYQPALPGYGAHRLVSALPTVAEIQREVADLFVISVSEIKSDRRARHIVRPRQIAMYLSRELTPKSLPEIGRRFGDRDHTTVIHAIRTIERLITCDGEIAEAVATLRGRLG